MYFHLHKVVCICAYVHTCIQAARRRVSAFCTVTLDASVCVSIRPPSLHFGYTQHTYERQAAVSNI
jgi:hypothetical protein